MNKTKVDDMLIEMIAPKLKEIEEKFSGGGALTQDDINTLLLKSQYNHINHLDTKLNEVVGSVFALEQKFTHLEKNFSHLEQKLSSDMANLEQKVSSDIANLDQKLSSDIANLEQKIEATIQKALNKNMMTLIVVIGAFLTLSKIIDKF
jgi:uncharacterized phage infection (PIP) family protein YhgE